MCTSGRYVCVLCVCVCVWLAAHSHRRSEVVGESERVVRELT